MRNRTSDHRRPTRVRSVRTGSTAAAALAALCMSSCEGLTDVSAPDVVQPSALQTPAGAAALWAGAVSRFTDAFSRTVAATGELTDELLNTAVTGSDTDRRTLAEGGLLPPYPYTDLHQARVATLQAIDALQRVAPKPPSRIGQLFALVGFTELFFGEHVCSGVPLGTYINGQPRYGTQLTTAEMLARSVAHLDSALAYAGDSVRIANLARVGRGRALLALGRYPEAAAAVSAVPTSYAYRSEHSATVQQNQVYNGINATRRLGVADRQGVNGLDFRSAADPRVPTQLVGKGLDGTTDVYGFTRYASLASPIVLASGTEARLIEAEAALRAGNAEDALAILNALRATTPGLAPLTLQATDAERVDQLFRERAFWLFLTGHRQGDLRRLVRHYGRAQDAVFPIGPYRGGQLFGAEVTFTPTNQQRENPNYKGCLNRAA